MKSPVFTLRLISFVVISAIFGTAVAGEKLPRELAGPKASRNVNHVMAYTLPLRDLTGAEFDHFMQGVALFEKDWTAEEGLGPQFNQQSCQACHPRDGRTGLYDDTMRLVRLPEFGGQIQDKAISGAEPEAQVSVSPGFRVQTKAHVNGHLDKEAVIVQPPQLVGLGLLEDIPAQAIEQAVMNQPDGISGRIHYVIDPETGKKVIGRFGWKAEQPGLKAQIAKASAEDMGLNNPLYHQNVGDPGDNHDIGHDDLDLLVDYVRALAVPARRIDPDSDEGFAIFKTIGCADCHRPSQTLDDGTVIWPFTDMLLHDTGNGPWDDGDFDPKHGNPVGAATKYEWRTPPLWGIGLLETVARDPVGYMHDGSAVGLAGAIEWHGNEAGPSVKKWRGLDAPQREKLLAFLRSL